MNIKKNLGILSVVVGASAYLYLVTMTSRGSGEGLSLTTFLLWSMLAWITTITTVKAGANPAVPCIYAMGSSATALILLYKGKIGWSSFDSIIAVLVVMCVILWLSKGARWALVLSVIAAVIAAVPFIIVTWKTPSSSPIIANSGFFFANILSFAAAKAWTLEDRLYPGANIIVCGLLVLPCLIG